MFNSIETICSLYMRGTLFAHNIENKVRADDSHQNSLVITLVKSQRSSEIKRKKKKRKKQTFSEEYITNEISVVGIHTIT